MSKSDLGMTPEDEHDLNCGTFLGERPDEAKEKKLLNEAVERLSKIKPEVEILASQITKLEDGDILLVTVPINTDQKHTSFFRQYMNNLVKEKMQLDAQVLVAAGDVKMSVLKAEKLGDIHQRLDDIEKRLPPRGLEIKG